MSRIPLPSHSHHSPSHNRTNSAQSSLAFPHHPVTDRAPSPLGLSPSRNRDNNQSTSSVAMSSTLSGQHGSMSETRRKQSKRDEVCFQFIYFNGWMLRVSGCLLGTTARYARVYLLSISIMSTSPSLIFDGRAHSSSNVISHRRTTARKKNNIHTNTPPHFPQAIRKKIESELSRKRTISTNFNQGSRGKRGGKPAVAKGTVAALKPSPALTVPENITVAEASQLCAAKRTDCVLVVDDEEGLSGIFTAKDLAYRVSIPGLVVGMRAFEY